MLKMELATDSDVEQLVPLINVCYGKESLKGWAGKAALYDSQIRATPESLREEMKQPGHNFFKCVDGDSGQIIGCVLAHYHEQEKEMHTGMLCVQPNLQSQGLGRKLMQAVEDRARELGCNKLKIEVISTRNELAAWYERLGYKRNGKVGHYTDPDPTKIPEHSMFEMEKLIE